MICFFLLGWIGFGVADWQQLQRYVGSDIEFYGLWAYCQEQGSSYATVCQRWHTAADELFNGTRPDFIRTSEGLITTGMIFLSLGLFVAILAALLPYLAYLAALFAFIAFIFLIVGLPIFGRQSNDFSTNRGDVEFNKRYGFWLMVPTIVLEFLAILFFLGAGILYKAFGYGNIGTSFSNKTPPFDNRKTNMGNIAYGGQQMLGPANMFDVPPNINIPYGASSPALSGTGGMASGPDSYLPFTSQIMPSLLSEYLAQRSPISYGPIAVRTSGMSVLPQPSFVRSITATPVSNITPSYLRMGEPIGPRFNPIINLSGQTIIGPIQRMT
jgi:hypothetical protein